MPICQATDGCTKLVYREDFCAYHYGVKLLEATFEEPPAPLELDEPFYDYVEKNPNIDEWRKKIYKWMVELGLDEPVTFICVFTLITFSIVIFICWAISMLNELGQIS